VNQKVTLVVIENPLLQGSTKRGNAQMSEPQFTEQDWRRLLTSLGEDPDRPGLVETPSRVAKAWKHWTAGYAQDPAECLKVFEDGAQEYNELIVVRGIPVYSHCEHHMAPFFGSATIGYVPNGKIVGLSKLTRLVDCFSKRLQVQERLTIQIANALMTHLQPQAVGVVIRCRHTCMESRGIRTQGEETVTSAMLGELQPNQALRAEFFALAHAA
jgi:GTP cyclohydrolase I